MSFSAVLPTSCSSHYVGTGKTHSIVNIVSAALVLGRKVLLSSQNVDALRAFMFKFPEQLRPLCLDMSSMEENNGERALLSALEKLEKELTTVKSRGKLTKEKVEVGLSWLFCFNVCQLVLRLA